MVGIRPRVLAAANIDQGLDGQIGMPAAEVRSAAGIVGRPSGLPDRPFWNGVDFTFFMRLLRIPLRTMLLQ
jgi:hypothetical protein